MQSTHRPSDLNISTVASPAPASYDPTLSSQRYIRSLQDSEFCADITTGTHQSARADEHPLTRLVATSASRPASLSTGLEDSEGSRASASHIPEAPKSNSKWSKVKEALLEWRDKVERLVTPMSEEDLQDKMVTDFHNYIRQQVEKETQSSKPLGMIKVVVRGTERSLARFNKVKYKSFANLNRAQYLASHDRNDLSPNQSNLVARVRSYSDALEPAARSQALLTAVEAVFGLAGADPIKSTEYLNRMRSQKREDASRPTQDDSSNRGPRLGDFL